MKYALRFVWYVLKIVFIAAAAFAVLAITFFIAMDSANVYVIVTDGMKARVTSALVPSQASDYSKYFTDAFRKNQPEIDVSKYQAFVLTGINYKLDVESLWCNPWQNTASVTVVESIPKMSWNEPLDLPEGKEKPVPPQWQRARYKIMCVRREDSWRIDSIEKIEDLLPEPTPTPEPTTYITASPLPTATSPGASAMPTPSAK